MLPKSGQSIRITGRGWQDATLAAFVTVMESDGYDGWEFVATSSTTGELRAIAIQPAGSWWNAIEPGAHDVASPGSLTARQVRAAPIGGLTATAAGDVRRRILEADDHRQWFAKAFGDDRGDFPHMSAAADLWREELQGRSGRRGKPDDAYLDLVLAYVRLVDGGERAPIPRLAAEAHMAPATIRNLLHAARRRGLLIGSPGVTGGALTQKALDLLDKRQEMQGG